MARFVECTHAETGATAVLAVSALRHLPGWAPTHDSPPAPPVEHDEDLDEDLATDSPDLGDDTPDDEEADR